MAAPTLIDYQQSTFSDTGTTTDTTPSVSWLAGDRILVVGLTEDTGVQFNAPTATGLTFAAIGTATAASNTRAYMWAALAGADGSSAISATNDGTPGARGIGVFVYRGSDGFGTPVVLLGSTAKTISVTRGQANSHVVVGMADWNQAGDVTVTPEPSSGGTQRVAEAVSGRADFFLFSWGDQGATGTTSYGIGSHTGSVDMTGLAVEVLGTASGGGGRTTKNTRSHPLGIRAGIGWRTTN